MPCPICQNPVNKTFAPFCSKVCKNIDLIHWFKEDYRIPTQEPLTDENGEMDENDQGS